MGFETQPGPSLDHAMCSSGPHRQVGSAWQVAPQHLPALNCPLALHCRTVDEKTETYVNFGLGILFGLFSCTVPLMHVHPFHSKVKGCTLTFPPALCPHTPDTALTVHTRTNPFTSVLTTSTKPYLIAGLDKHTLQRNARVTTNLSTSSLVARHCFKLHHTFKRVTS